MPRQKKKPGVDIHPRLFRLVVLVNSAYSAEALDLRNLGRTTHSVNSVAKPTSASVSSMVSSSPKFLCKEFYGRKEQQ